MTTIAFDGNMLAVDSLVTEKGRIIGHSYKITKLNPRVCMIVVGNAGVEDYFKNLLESVTNTDSVKHYLQKVDPIQLEGARIIVFDGEVYEIYKEKDGPVSGYLHPHSCSFGSGKEFAQGVLSLGMTADYAVAAGIVSSTTSGGDISTVKIKDGELNFGIIELRDMIMPHRFGELDNETFTAFKPVNL